MSKHNKPDPKSTSEEVSTNKEPESTKSTNMKHESRNTQGGEPQITMESNTAKVEARETYEQSKNTSGKSLENTEEDESRNRGKSEDKNTNNLDEFTKIKEDIIGSCGALPLAIVVVAGLLTQRDPNKVSHWKTVKESLN